MGRGGMGGGHGKGMRGGKGGEGAKGDAAADAASPRDDYPLPPTLKIDSVLLVQQDAQAFQVRLDNGQTLEVKLDGQPRQTMSGAAMANGRREGANLRLSIRLADGSQLVERWVLSADGRQLSIFGDWKVPALEQAVSFRRDYVALH
jgi:hypothetical protein